MESNIDLTINNIGVQGTALFGVGITDTLPLGMSEMAGTTTEGHENYGNYRSVDGSIMCWIPMFYYRWGASDSPRSTKYGLNSLDVKSKYDFTDVAAANAAGYALHRAFYDNGEIKDGFFVDKYQASNNSGIASSIKNSVPISAHPDNNPFSVLSGSISNTSAGAIDAIKTRGSKFFVTTIFIQRALSLLSMAHGQATNNVTDCAWYDVTGATNYPKGNNSESLSDVNDATVKYSIAAYQKVGRTGSGLPFAKTAHNGQKNGVVDLNGNLSEICLGLTQLSGKYYALKTSVAASSLTSGSNSISDAWGEVGITAKYDSLGLVIGALNAPSDIVSSAIGSLNNPVFSNAVNGVNWAASCAGIPLAGGNSQTGTDLFGHDKLIVRYVNNMCPIIGGDYNDGINAGMWALNTIQPNTASFDSVGVRAALYI